MKSRLLTLDEMAAAIRERPCPSGKVPHMTFKAADEAATQINGKPVKYGPPRVSAPYQCSDCGLWHVGRKRWTVAMREAAAQQVAVIVHPPKNRAR